MNSAQESEALTGREIAVIGMSGRFPGASGLEEFWRNLRNGVEGVVFFNDTELSEAGVHPAQIQDPNYIKAGSLLDGVDLFDASFFGYTAADAEILDPQQRLFLEHAWQALEDAGYAPREYEGLIGVYAGAAWNTYLLRNLTTRPDLFDDGGFQVFISSDKDFMPTRAAYKLNLKGPSMIVQTSCSTSLVAVHLACLSLLNYECDIALAGGVTVKVPQKSGYLYQPGGLASPDGHCRAFDAGAAGTIFGSGVGIVALKRLTEAIDDGDAIRAIIKSSAINNDGSAKISYTAPSVEGQAQVVAAAHAMAGFAPDTIRYIETHGTGTSLGDPVEVTALTKAFRKHTERRQFCAIGSVKSNIGHLDAAAGIAGFLKTVLALQHQEIPPSINFERPNPVIPFEETPFYVNSKLAKWERDGVRRRAGVSSFGVGGTNAHVIVEEAPNCEPSGPSRSHHLLTMSARSSESLERTTENLALWVRQNESAKLPDVAYTLNIGRTTFRHRRFAVCRDRSHALTVLEESNRAQMPVWTDADEPRDRAVVFLFPGQGTQYPGMARGIHESEPAFRRSFDECAGILKPLLHVDLQEAVFAKNLDVEQASARLEQTALSQPALFAVEYSLAQLWMEWGIRPAAMLGHSIGEYVAACLAGVFSLHDALAIVAERGRLMQQQPAGSMLAVSLSEDELLPLLSAKVSLAAVNDPNACVLSGEHESIALLERTLDAQGVPTRRLHTSHAFHSGAMDPILGAFSKQVNRVARRPPQIPFLSNLTGSWIAAEDAVDPGYWARHLRQTVRFSACLQELLKDRERVFLEVGPGRTLSALTSRHPDRLDQPVISSMRTPKDDSPDMSVALEGLGRLWLAGVKIDWRSFYQDQKRQRVPLPTYPFERQRYWLEPRQTPRSGDELKSTGLERNPNIADWFYVPYWRPAPLVPTSASEHGRWLLFGSGPQLEQLRSRIEELGDQVVCAESEDYGEVLSQLHGQGTIPAKLVYLLSLDSQDESTNSVAEFDHCQRRGFYCLLALLKALAGYRSDTFDLTVAVQRAAGGGKQSAMPPEWATLYGLCRVAPQELPNVKMRLIASAFSEETGYGAEGVIAEVNAGTDDLLISWHGNTRRVPAFEPLRLEAPQNKPALLPGGVYLVTGAFSGNGLGIAKYLARNLQARLILPASRSIQSSIRTEVEAMLKHLGAAVLIVTADVAEPEALNFVWQEAETEFGPVDGAFHAEEAGGENAFRSIEEVTSEDCDLHFKPKAHPLYAIRELAEAKKCGFCLVVSSIATVLGGVGYGAYVAANSFVDAFVSHANLTSQTRWISLALDLWLTQDGDSQMATARGDLAPLAMTSDQGEEVLARALAARGLERLLVSTANLSAREAAVRNRLADLRSRAQHAPDGPQPALHPRPPLANPFVPARSEMERKIANVWQTALGFDQIGIDDNFFELGGDSLIAMRVASRLRQELDIDFPAARLYQGVTVRALAEVLAEDSSATEARRSAELAEHKEAAARRRDFIESRRPRVRVPADQ